MDVQGELVWKGSPNADPMADQAGADPGGDDARRVRRGVPLPLQRSTTKSTADRSAIPDHERRFVTDPHDEADFSTILYSGTPGRRHRHREVASLGAGRDPRARAPRDVHGHDPRHRSSAARAEIGRFMIRKQPARQAASGLVRAGNLRPALRQAPEPSSSFCYCAPGLINYYRKLGARPFGGRLVPYSRRHDGAAGQRPLGPRLLQAQRFAAGAAGQAALRPRQARRHRPWRPTATSSRAIREASSSTRRRSGASFRRW